MNESERENRTATRGGEPLRVAVFASGGGTNLQALLDRFAPSVGASAAVRLVVGSREGIGALERARRAGVEAAVVDVREHSADEVAGRMLELLDAARIELVVLAGYMHLVPESVVRRFDGAMINVHPALLPAFGGSGLYGLRVHRAVLASGARVSGATVHLVDASYDTGRILAQWPVPVLPSDSPESLAARVLAVEHRLLPTVVSAFAAANGGTEAPPPTTDPLAFELIVSDAPAPDGMRALISVPPGSSPDGR
jgi:phosphoribosylglycinamide formyltransferase 1